MSMPKPPSTITECNARFYVNVEKSSAAAWRARYQKYFFTDYNSLSHLFSVPEKRCSLELFPQFCSDIGAGDRGE
jgi:hypothetical protein